MQLGPFLKISLRHWLIARFHSQKNNLINSTDIQLLYAKRFPFQPWMMAGYI